MREHDWDWRTKGTQEVAVGFPASLFRVDDLDRRCTALALSASANDGAVIELFDRDGTSSVASIFIPTGGGSGAGFGTLQRGSSWYEVRAQCTVPGATCVVQAQVIGTRG